MPGEPFSGFVCADRFYGAGWMAQGEATNWEADRAKLVDAAAYRAHCLGLEPGATVDVR